MPTISPNSRRALRALAAGALALPILVGAASTGSADETALAAVSHPELDYAGSTIAANEGTGGAPAAAAAPAGLPGIDVSHFQGNVDWGTVAKNNQYAYIKATEGTGYKDANFGGYYDGAYGAGMIRGAYHFGLPDRSGGAAQAQFFVNNGGGWSADGKTLPPMLDMEYNPYGDRCYGKDGGAMTAWITDFSNEVHRLTNRYPTIYTTRDWWASCTGDNGSLGATNPLFLACYCASAGTMPKGWGTYTFWQYTSKGSTPGVPGPVDQDVFNGAADRLQALAKG